MCYKLTQRNFYKIKCLGLVVNILVSNKIYRNHQFKTNVSSLVKDSCS